MVVRAALDIALLGFGVFVFAIRASLAQQMKETKKLTEGETRAARLIGVLVGSGFGVLAVADLVLAALGRGWLFL